MNSVTSYSCFCDSGGFEMVKLSSFKQKMLFQVSRSTGSRVWCRVSGFEDFAAREAPFTQSPLIPLNPKTLNPKP